jgi:hypothetical protein
MHGSGSFVAAAYTESLYPAPYKRLKLFQH